MSRHRGPFGKLARWVLDHRTLVLVVSAVITLLAVGLSTRLKVDSNLLHLMPESEPDVAALLKLHAEEGGASMVTLGFEAKDPAELDPFLDGLTEDLGKIEGVKFALHEIDPDLAFRLGLLSLSPDEVSSLNTRLHGALVLGPALNPIVTQRLMDMGPLTEKIAKAGEQKLFGDGATTGRVVVRPEGAAADTVFAKKLVADIQAAVDRADPEAHGIRLTWMGGAYRHNVEDREGMWTDIQKTGVASFVLVLLCIVVAFRSIRATILLYLPVLAASAINLALVWAIYGSINTYTSFGTAILLGLGIDYGTHLVARYREKRAKGMEMEEAIVRAWDVTGPPCVTSAVTSIAGFLALAAGRFEGFTQLGVVLALGLAISVVCGVVVTPALIPWLDANPPMLLGASHHRSKKKATYRLAPLGLALVVLLAGLAATRLTRLEWEFDLSALRRDGLAYNELTPEEQRIALDSYSPAVITLANAEEVRKEHRRVEEQIKAGNMPHASRVVSIESVLPADQADRLVALQELVKTLDHPSLRYLPPPLVKNLLRLKGFDARPVTREELPPSLLALLGADGGHQRLLVFPRGNMWDLREASKFSEEIHRVFPQTAVAGELLSMGALYKMVRTDIPWIAGLALVLVAALTLVDVRRFHWFVGAYGTLLAGMVFAGAALQIAGVKLSMVNIVGLPILVGIGIDVVIHLLHRLREEGPGGIGQALRTTGIAAVVSTATTVVSFASLIFAGNRGIRSLGILVSVGLTAVFVVTCILLPLAWAAGWRLTGRSPAATDAKASGPSEP